MKILDENIIVSQRLLLDSWRIHYRRIGGEVGWYGMKDQSELIPLLHTLRQPTFFTRDRDFYHARLRHHDYFLVFLEVSPIEAAQFICRFLRHNLFRTQTQRMGKVVCADKSRLTYWQVGVKVAPKVDW